MATPRTTFVLAVLVVLATAYLLFFEPRIESTDERAISERRILHVHANQVVAMKLRRDAWTFAAVERIDGATFKRTEPVPGAADSAAIGEILSDLEFLDHQTVLPGHGTQTAYLYDEGFSPPHLSAILTLVDHRELEFDLGSETPTVDGVYLHVRDDSAVQIVPTTLKTRLDQMLDKLADTSSTTNAEASNSDGTKGNAQGGD